MEDGSIRVAEVTEDSLGTYTCMPYNTLGSMGWSAPAPLVLKVLHFPTLVHSSSSWVKLTCLVRMTPEQDPPKFSVVPGGEYRQEAGRELVIPCEAEGDPFPNITWRKVWLYSTTSQMYNKVFCERLFLKWFPIFIVSFQRKSPSLKLLSVVGGYILISVLNDLLIISVKHAIKEIWFFSVF